MQKAIRISSVFFACAVFAVIILFLIPTGHTFRVAPFDRVIDGMEYRAALVPPDLEGLQFYARVARESHKRELMEAKLGAYLLEAVASALATLVLAHSLLDRRRPNQSPEPTPGSVTSRATVPKSE